MGSVPRMRLGDWPPHPGTRPLDAQRWQTLRRLLEQALELEPRGRGSFLDRAVGREGPLRAELDALLALEHESRHFIEPPSSDELPGFHEGLVDLLPPSDGPVCRGPEQGPE